jgi:Pyruvate/2-oxoacid:ferredoxin oxidoreductase gamma subunit
MVSGSVLVSTAMLGAFLRASGLVSMESLEKALPDTFTTTAATRNISFARLFYGATRSSRIWYPEN